MRWDGSSAEIRENRGGWAHRHRENGAEVRYGGTSYALVGKGAQVCASSCVDLWVKESGGWKNGW